MNETNSQMAPKKMQSELSKKTFIEDKIKIWKISKLIRIKRWWKSIFFKSC